MTTKRNDKSYKVGIKKVLWDWLVAYPFTDKGSRCLRFFHVNLGLVADGVNDGIIARDKLQGRSLRFHRVKRGRAEVGMTSRVNPAAHVLAAFPEKLPDPLGGFLPG